MNRAGEIGSCFRSRLQSFQVDVLKVVKFQLKFIFNGIVIIFIFLVAPVFFLLGTCHVLFIQYS